MGSGYTKSEANERAVGAGAWQETVNPVAVSQFHSLAGLLDKLFNKINAWIPGYIIMDMHGQWQWAVHALSES